MSDPHDVRNIWAPWRMEYIEGLSSGREGCFLCHHRDEPANDQKNFVLWRSQRAMVVLNRFPYTGGHCMVAPYQHAPELADLDDQTILEMMQLVRDSQQVIVRALGAGGFNVGMNIGRCAGAGLPDHLHIHVVPRWSGDTNFMAVLGDVRVIPQWLGETYSLLRRTAQEMDLPKASR